MPESSVSFSELLGSKVEDAERPPPQPEGTWTFMCKSFEEVTSSRKQTPGVEFTLVPVSAEPDVEQAALEDWIKQIGSLQDKEIHGNHTTFWITKDALPMLRDFIEKCGIDITGRTFKQALADVPGCQVKGTVKHVMSQEPGSTDIYANITKYMAA